LTFKTTYVLVVLSLCFISCQREGSETLYDGVKLPEIPDYFPEIDFPDDNNFTQARWDLGKKLFYDPIMSVDSSLHCGSCHKASIAFSDNVPFSPGVEGRPGTRNAPSLSNVAYHPYYTREGGIPTLEMQILVPIQEHNEFDFNIVEISNRLVKIPEYVEMSEKAYGRAPDHFVITRAIACFERTLVSGRSTYDKYRFVNDPLVFSPDEKAGFDLFFSERLSCAKCHIGFDFTNYAFENNGLYENYLDVGRFRLTGLEEDKFLFKVPSLRNVALTAPYMHDGSLKSLDEVIDHYNMGGMTQPKKSKLIKPLYLSEMEKTQLKSFLKTLTDYTFITNEKFQ
jgi:cytochrome c peroxidase